MQNTFHPIRITKCPFCGGTEFVYGFQGGYGAVTREGSIFAAGQYLHHVICRNCGSVVHSYVNYPEKLLSWSQRKKADK